MSEGRKHAQRITVSLQCSVCGSRNYKTHRARREDAAVLVLKKYCKNCKQHTEHREGR